MLPFAEPDIAIVLISGVGYLVAALLALRMPVDLLGPDREEEHAPVRAALGGVVRGMVDGLRHLRERRSAARALTVIAASRFCYGLTAVSIVLLYRNYFHDSTDTDAALSGLALAVLVSGLGFLLAAIITPAATAVMTPARWIVVLLVLASVVEVMPGALFTQWGILAAAFGLGLAAQGVKICVDTLVQLGVDDEFRGRVFSLYDVIFNVVFVAAAAVGALVIPTDGRSIALFVCISIGYAVTALVYALAGRRPSR